jgi:hypothetical protein
MSGFHVPSGLVERGAAGLDLIRHCQMQWMGKDRGASNGGQVAFAAWIMRNPGNAGLLPMASPIIERLLTGELLPSEQIAALIERETASSVMHDAWTNSSFRAAGEPARKGDDAEEIPPAAASWPTLATCGAWFSLGDDEKARFYALLNELLAAGNHMIQLQASGL